jgi:hypothetical protein
LPSQAVLAALRRQKKNRHDNSLYFLRAACLKHIHHFPLHYKTMSLSFARTFGPWFREQT